MNALQIKGKGNGNIHPKYVGYVVKFLELVGMTVSDNEMAHLGYINISKFKDELSSSMKLFNGKYIPEDEKLIGKDGNEFASFDLWDIKPLIKQVSDTEIKINFKLDTFIPLSFDFLFKRAKKEKLAEIASGNYSKAASSGDYSKAASSGNYSKAASSGNYSTAASSGNYSKAASSGNYSTAASSGNYSTAASSGDYSKAASSGNYSKAASSGDYSTAASSGNYSTAASSGNYSTAASLGNRTWAESQGDQSIACALGAETKTKGKIGTWLVLSEWDKDWKKIKAIKSTKVDGKKIKEDQWYELKKGKFVEVK